MRSHLSPKSCQNDERNMAWFGSYICGSDSEQRASNRHGRYLAEQGKIVGLLGKFSKRLVRSTLCEPTSFVDLYLLLVEYHCTKSMDVASRIFEKGLQTFGEDAEYVLWYLGFLISVNS